MVKAVQRAIADAHCNDYFACAMPDEQESTTAAEFLCMQHSNDDSDGCCLFEPTLS